MGKSLRHFFYFFLVLASLSIGLLIFTEAKSDDAKTTTNKLVFPDEYEGLLNSLLSAIGGFGGGGVLLLFLIRRLVNSYDANFAKFQTMADVNEAKQSVRNTKIMNSIEGVHTTVNNIKLEITRLQANSVDKETITRALTKVTMLETDMEQVQDEIKQVASLLMQGKS